MSTTNIARLATTGSNTFIGNQTITGSLSITGSLIGMVGDGISINRIGGQPYVYLKKDGTDLGSIYGKTGGGLILYNATTAAITIDSSANVTINSGQLNLTGAGTTGLDLSTSTYSYAMDLANNQFIRQKNASGTLGLLLGMSSDNNTYVRGFSGVTIQTNNGTNAITINSSQNATFAGTITESSSIRYKENIETIKYSLDKVLQMRGVTYDKKNTGVKEIGVIAEEVYDILPEVVLKNEEGEIDSVSYGRIVGVLIEAIKEQQKQIEELKSLIK